jgi:hypothetical protein
MECAKLVGAWADGDFPMPAREAVSGVGKGADGVHAGRSGSAAGGLETVGMFSGQNVAGTKYSLY